MTAPEHPDDHDHLPATWTQGARDTYQAVLDERPNMTAAEVAQLWHACALESAAERHDEVALAAGMVARGSTGQPIPHPSAVEARLARSAAAAILAKLQPAAHGTPSERARRAARARWSA
ncbi:hypothetical protein HC028_18520 [Planosporangium flavigriseum]|nr:hypothetical protein [Planosporangium flavigriseum]NJC66483.1 hypothetical protein [Planosporangium flavigriseum]